MIELRARAAALRSLAALVRAGVPLRCAIDRWPEDVPGAPGVRAASRRMKMGASLPVAFEALARDLGSDAAALGGVATAHAQLGGDLTAMLESLAQGIERRAGAMGDGRAAGAGARASGRVVGGLPVALLTVSVITTGPPSDAPGIAAVALGGGLAAACLAWIGRLTPRPPTVDDPAAALADLVAACLAGGAPLATVLDTLAARPPPGLELTFRAAAGRARLGIPWPDALAAGGDEPVCELAATLRRSLDTGTPVATALRAFARARRDEQRRSFEERLRRAPVRMAVPVSVCGLPAFLLLGVAPLLRSL